MDTYISKINVLELNSGFVSAGGARNLFSFCKYLDKTIFDVFAASYGSGGPGEKILDDLQIKYVIASGSSRKIIDFMKEKKINVVHIHRSGVYVPIEYEILNAIKLHNPNIIIIEKNVFGNYSEKIASFIHCSMFQSMMHIHERFLPSSGQKFDFNKMKVLYNSIDISSFEKHRASAEEITDFKKRLGIGQDDFVIGKIARPHIAKWNDLLLTMMPYLVNMVPNIKFIIIGAPHSRVKKIKKSKEKDHFILLDETSDEKFIHTFYQTIDLLAHSSKIGECNGNTINEAMFWGKPVVVNSTPARDNGQLEQVAHMHDGIIANHPQTFARAIAYLYNDQARRLLFGENAHKKVIRVNNPGNIVKQLEKVIMEQIDSMQNTGFSHCIKDTFYSPSEKEIIEYKEEYKKRLLWEFDELTVNERFVNFCKKPVNCYYKVKDFLEHRINF